MSLRLKGFIAKWAIYFIGLLVMAYGIVLTIKADFGVSPWDVLHIGLFKQLGLTIGSWSIIVGFIVLALSAILTKSWPKMGAFLNMLSVGVFIDLYMLLPFLKTPSHVLNKIVMLAIGIVVMGYGMGLYIAARCGAGPRDSLMIALTQLTGWKVQYIRGVMEVLVLVIGWMLGGPVFIGTIIFSVVIGPVVGVALPQCQLLADKIVIKLSQPTIPNMNHISQ
ncbi:YitT family protein [Bacillus sp. HMF5848]|uniref:YczE/YyaS/YitT family protein n=1 Tax=Bacillus sp. HMF5848 TaxID=2495421 RepID=UPI000F77AD63|nr:YitT family protein [Bacillus sp. HMF5848]RSK29390.1 YitT family protein [Bacillus sp. HMF5848]